MTTEPAYKIIGIKFSYEIDPNPSLDGFPDVENGLWTFANVTEDVMADPERFEKMLNLEAKAILGDATNFMKGTTTTDAGTSPETVARSQAWNQKFRDNLRAAFSETA